MKVFVTGGAGFIGSHVVDALIEDGNEVTIFDNLSKGHKEFINKKALFIEGDLKDFDKLTHSVKGHDAVIHMAAEIMIQDSIDNPKEFLKRNIMGTINLLEAMKQNNIKKIVFSSSAAVYGETGNEAVKEDAPKFPLQPYGASKLACEAILSAYYNSFGINSVSLRYFNVYGPRDEVKPVIRAVPKWIKSSLQGKPLTLYWGGKQVKDFIFVKDIADAHLVALKNCKGVQVYNVGFGEGKPMTDILKIIVDISGKSLEIIDLGERKGDPQKLVADISKIKSNLNWAPKYTLQEGLKITYDYYKNNLPDK
jgi:dTDP-glucose 4,6-dehydratase